MGYWNFVNTAIKLDYHYILRGIDDTTMYYLAEITKLFKWLRAITSQQNSIFSGFLLINANFFVKYIFAMNVMQLFRFLEFYHYSPDICVSLQY